MKVSFSGGKTLSPPLKGSINNWHRERNEMKRRIFWYVEIYTDNNDSILESGQK